MLEVTSTVDKLHQAISLHQSAQLAEAEALYREIVAETTSLPDACHNLATLLLYKETPTAVDLFRIALESSPEQGQYWLSYIEGLIIAGQFEAAKEVLEVAKNCGLENSQTNRVRSMLCAQHALAPSTHEITHWISLFTSGCIDEAEKVARELTQKHPGHGTGWKALGATLAQQGKWRVALPALAKAAELLPVDAESHFNLGLAYQQNSEFINAEASYFRALTIKINYPEVYNNLGLMYEANGERAKAILLFQKAISIKSEYEQAHNNLALSLHHDGRFSEAINHFNQAILVKPQYAEACNNLGASLQSIGALTEAEATVRRSIAISPFCASAYNNLGNILQEAGNLDEAEKMLRKALEINPDLPDAFNNLGNLYQRRKKFKEACSFYRRAVEIKPNDPLSWNNLGTAAQSLGEFPEAISCYKSALEVDPVYHNAHSNLLFALNYVSERNPEEDFKLAMQYGKSVAAKAKRYDRWNCNFNPDRLRVGIVSGDMLSHPVGYFLESVVKELVSDCIELFAYSTHYQTDALTLRILPKFTEWKSIYGLTDVAAASTIHSDAIHILIDISGHTAFNRLSMFAYKPAPVQVSWLGYFATTGVQEVDYLIADPWTLPDNEECYFTESIWRLPETRLCFTPPETHVETSRLPALANGYITFGCFNNLGKMNDEVVKTWAEILHAVPASKLMLKSPQLLERETQETTINRYSRFGISADRLILEGPSSREEYLTKYHLIDLALDPFPFTGGTTSAESLWMGVPVITLAGKRFISRQGLGIMKNAGMDGWIAETVEDYKDLAINHAQEVDQLDSLRSTLRTQVLASPLFDAKRFARHFEDALWGMWRASKTSQHA